MTQLAIPESAGRPPVTRVQAAARRDWLREKADTWPGTWQGYCAAFRHELSRLLVEGLDFDAAEDQAVANLPAPPQVAPAKQERPCR